MSAIVLLVIGLMLFTEKQAPNGLIILLAAGLLLPSLVVDLTVILAPRRREPGDPLAGVQDHSSFDEDRFAPSDHHRKSDNEDPPVEEPSSNSPPKRPQA